MGDISVVRSHKRKRLPQGKLVPSTTADLVLENLRGRILKGELAPGSPLRQDALAAEFGVNRAPIRQAIAQLQGEGLVRIVAHKGAYVCDFSVDDIREMFEIRLRLEPWIYSCAIPLTNDAVLAEAMSLVDPMGASEVTRGPLNWRVHEILYAPSGLGFAIKTLRQLTERNERYFRFQAFNASILESSRREHLEMIEMSRTCNVRGGMWLLREHLLRAMEQMVDAADHLRSQGKAPRA
ncbi:GntR family transcriptional regulator [Paraburkholderia bannensis]|uniref:GntR family transcriptional regulator n=1 Tax=Paraburkholderia bannensis TaxID=765414 RepID=UPI002AC3205E|nr:GntR family transcriptional regulator [Paraburkholderia bannensis]